MTPRYHAALDTSSTGPGMRTKQIIWTVVIVLAAVGATSGHLDTTSESYADRALRNALVTFAVARTLNGVISAAQGTEVALEPGGVGVILSVGEILDPINDLIEQFSGVMLVAASSLGLQILLLHMTSWWGVTVVMIAAAVAFFVTLWAPRSSMRRYASPALRLLLLTLFLRFAVPVLLIGTNAVADLFLASEQQEATAALEATTTEIERYSEQPPVAPDVDESLMDRLGSMLDDSLRSLRVSERLAKLKDSASNAAENIVRLIAIFVLQTIILPLAFLWLFVEGLKAIAARSTRLFPPPGSSTR